MFISGMFISGQIPNLLSSPNLFPWKVLYYGLYIIINIQCIILLLLVKFVQTEQKKVSKNHSQNICPITLYIESIVYEEYL